MTALEFLRDPRSSARRREAARRILLDEDELRAEDAMEEADLRAVAEDDQAEASIRGSYGEA